MIRFLSDVTFCYPCKLKRSNRITYAIRYIIRLIREKLFLEVIHDLRLFYLDLSRE